MSMKTWILGALVTYAWGSERQTRLLIEVSRHGARSSSSIYPLTINDPYDNFQTPMELTSTGAQ